MTARFLIVDDHPLTRDALAGLLSQAGSTRSRPGRGRCRRRPSAAELPPDVVVLDLTMPGDGRAHGPAAAPRGGARTPVVVLTAAEDETNLLAAIRLGAAGYLLKSEPPERIVEFLHGVAAGRGGALGRGRAAAARAGPRRRRPDAACSGGLRERLSARELEVLLLLDQHLATARLRPDSSSPSTPCGHT